jgi:hypothetical protein
MYHDGLCEELLDYFDIPPFRKETQEVYDKKAQEVKTITVTIANELPTLAGFASVIGVHRDTLNEWEKVHPEFSDAVKRAKAHQERILVSNGLSDRYNSTMTIFALKNLADWKDRQSHDHSGSLVTTPPVINVTVQPPTPEDE